MRKQVSKTELSPDNGCVIDTKWKVGPLSYHACAAMPKDVHGKPLDGNLRLTEIIIYDHTGFKGAYARTNLSFHSLGDLWHDAIRRVIVVSGFCRFYSDEYYNREYWE